MPSVTLSPVDFLFSDFSLEFASTRRVLERYPDGKGSWRPHDRSRSLGELATHLADIVNRGTTILETESLEIGARKPVDSKDSSGELLAHFDAGVERLTAALAGASYEMLEKPWAMTRGGAVFRAMPRRVALRAVMMSHSVHHRAQLCVYYRLLDMPVPGVYGPSADD